MASLCRILSWKLLLALDDKSISTPSSEYWRYHNTTKTKAWWNMSPSLFLYSFSGPLHGITRFLIFQYFSLKEWSPAGRTPLQICCPNATVSPNIHSSTGNGKSYICNSIQNHIYMILTNTKLIYQKITVNHHVERLWHIWAMIRSLPWHPNEPRFKALATSATWNDERGMAQGRSGADMPVAQVGTVCHFFMICVNLRFEARMKLVGGFNPSGWRNGQLGLLFQSTNQEHVGTCQEHFSVDGAVIFADPGLFAARHAAWNQKSVKTARWSSQALDVTCWFGTTFRIWLSSHALTYSDFQALECFSLNRCTTKSIIQWTVATCDSSPNDPLANQLIIYQAACISRISMYSLIKTLIFDGSPWLTHLQHPITLSLHLYCLPPPPGNDKDIATAGVAKQKTLLGMQRSSSRSGAWSSQPSAVWGDQLNLHGWIKWWLVCMMIMVLYYDWLNLS